MKLLSKYIRINMIVVAGVLLLSCVLLTVLINKILIDELDEELSEVQTKLITYIHKTDSIPAVSPLYNYQLECSAVSDTSEGIHSKTSIRYIPEKNGSRKFRQLVFFAKTSKGWFRLGIEKQIEGVQVMGRALISLSLLTVLFVIGLQLFINRLVLQRLWNPFYQTLAIMRSFKLNKAQRLEFPPTNIEEFSYMNEILRETTQKADQDYIALKEFTENASHELQTPLSIISSKLDLLLQDEQLTERQNQAMTGTYTALKKMAHLNQSLLLLAKIGNHQFSEVQNIALHEKIGEKTEQFHELWQSQQLTLEENLQEAFIRINPDLCDILVNNLFSNVTKHNVPGGFIRLVLRQGHFSISNSGPEKALDQQKIFRRFYKSDQSSGSNGLGLSIIKQICDASGIQIHYHFEKNAHTFVLTWII